MTNHETLMRKLKAENYQIESYQLIHSNDLDSLIDLGLKTMVVCAGGVVSSPDTATRLATLDVASIALWSGLGGLMDIKRSIPGNFDVVVNQLLKLDSVVALLSKETVAESYGPIYEQLENLHCIPNRIDARNFIASRYKPQN